MMDRLEIMHSRAYSEQNYFWQRFTAFSALHAGFFVLAASSSPLNTIFLSVLGLMLSISWVLVQLASQYYVTREKDPYYDLCEKELDIPRPTGYTIFGHKLASTCVGTAVSFVVLSFWVVLFIVEVF